VQDVLLAMLAKEPSHGYGLRRRLRKALGPFGEALNAGLICCEQSGGCQSGRVGRRVAAGGRHAAAAGRSAVAGGL
jgi:hypothetical protein